MERTRNTYLALVAVLMLPVGANADLVRVDYEGTVLSTVNSDYTSGDSISGWFEFDTDDLIDYFGYGLYSDGPVSSNQSSVVDVYPDQLDYDRFIDYSSAGYDELSFRDGSKNYCYYSCADRYYGYDVAEHQIGLRGAAEWFDIDDVLGGGSSWIDVSAYSKLSFMYDYSYFCETSSSGCVEYYSFYTSFRVDSLHLNANANAKAVPEPGTLALLGIGLFGMGLTRRRKTV